VWIGNDQGESLPRSMTLPDGSTDQVNSSRQPIYVWTDFMEAALRGRPADEEGFPVPDGITFRTFDRETGAAASGGTRAAFPAGAELPQRAFASALTVELPIDQATGMRATADTPVDRIEVLRVAPGEIDQYLPAADGGP